MTFSELKELEKTDCWAGIGSVPQGIIETEEQWNYLKEYSKHISIDDRYLTSFEEDKGKWLNLGSWFGGASFYWSLNKQLPNFDTEYYKKFPPHVEWYWGKNGKIDFRK